MSLSQIELVWFRVRLEWECFWVNLREDNKGLNPRWQCLNSTWQNSRWLPSSSYVRRNEFEADWNSLSQGFVHNGWIKDGNNKDGRIQDGCHHQVRWEGMSLSQIELVWFRVRVEWECLSVNLREDNKGLNPRWQCLNSTWQNSRWLPSSSWVRMNERSYFCAKWLNPRWPNSRWLPSSSWVRMSEWSFFVQMVGREMWISFFVQMVGTILGKCEWVWEEKLRWLNPRWPNWRRLPSSS